MSIRAALFSLLLLAGAANALDLDPADKLYAESFDGETVFPTAPDLDLVAAGGMDTTGSHTPPTLTGTVAHAARVNDGLSIVVTSSNSLSDEYVVARGSFDDFSMDASAAASVELRFSSVEESAASVAASVVLVFDASFREFRITEGSSSTNIGSVVISLAEANAILGGAPFSVDLALDLEAGEAQASYQVQGFAENQTAVVSLSGTYTNPDLSGSAQGLVNLGAGNASLDLDDHEIYRPTSLFSVDTTTDAVDASPGDGACDTGAGACSLRAAIQETNALPGFGTVVLPSGTYTFSLAGAGEDAAATGDLDVTSDIELLGGGRATTVVDAATLDRVFEIHPGVTAELRDLRITNGFASTAAGYTGGGVENASTLVLERCTIDHNLANVAGGIMNRGVLEMIECDVHDNSAVTLGFASALAGGIAGPSTATGGSGSAETTIRRSAIFDNTAASIGGAEFSHCASAELESVTVSNNSATSAIEGLGHQLHTVDCEMTLQSTTLVELDDLAVSAASSASGSILFTNVAVEGFPACALSSPTVAYDGNNASNDTTCGFSAPGSIEGVDLGLPPLGPVADSQAHPP